MFPRSVNTLRCQPVEGNTKNPPHVEISSETDETQASFMFRKAQLQYMPLSRFANTNVWTPGRGGWYLQAQMQISHNIYIYICIEFLQAYRILEDSESVGLDVP